MTSTQARIALSKPLRFGDPEQIAAKLTLVAIDALKSACRGAKLCPACDGAGIIPVCGCGRDCDTFPGVKCPAQWFESCAICNESGAVDSDGEPIADLCSANDGLRDEIIAELRKAAS